MRDKFNSSMSIEKMAAWLDGNLSAGEMTQMAEQINADPMLEELVYMSDEIDGDIEAFEASGESLPDELQGDFDIPDPDCGANRRLTNMLGVACYARPAYYAEYDCCDAAPAASSDEALDNSDEGNNLLDEVKDHFSENDD